jgi:predicted lipoprotein with Yx(FWY)xxD motif
VSPTLESSSRIEEAPMKKILVLLALAVVVPVAGASSAAPTGPAANDAGAMSMKPALKVRNTRFGRVLFDGRDRVLYAFTRDKRGGKSTCYGACAAAWPVYFSRSTVKAMRGVRQSLIGTVRRRNGRLQVTYNGWPLYFYAHEGPREVKCQNVDSFGGLWLVVRPNGTLVR